MKYQYYVKHLDSINGQECYVSSISYHKIEYSNIPLLVFDDEDQAKAVVDYLVNTRDQDVLVDRTIVQEVKGS